MNDIDNEVDYSSHIPVDNQHIIIVEDAINKNEEIMKIDLELKDLVNGIQERNSLVAEIDSKLEPQISPQNYPFISTPTEHFFPAKF